jgi:hypothetical protein
MDHIAAAEERIVSERVQQKLHQVNLAAKEHLSPIQDHVNFTLQVSLSLSLSLSLYTHWFMEFSGLLDCYSDMGVLYIWWVFVHCFFYLISENLVKNKWLGNWTPFGFWEKLIN